MIYNKSDEVGIAVNKDDKAFGIIKRTVAKEQFFSNACSISH